MTSINKSIKTCKTIQNICISICIMFAIGVVALCGEPAPGHEGLSLAQWLIGEVLCVSGTALFGFVAFRAEDHVKYLQRRKRRIRG